MFILVLLHLLCYSEKGPFTTNSLVFFGAITFAFFVILYNNRMHPASDTFMTRLKKNEDYIIRAISNYDNRHFLLVLENSKEWEKPVPYCLLKTNFEGYSGVSVANLELGGYIRKNKKGKYYTNLRSS